MIIGIHGRKQHGKNTLGYIFQYLLIQMRGTTIGWDDESLIHSILEGEPYNLNMHDWKQVSFAYKLKQIVCILIGCTMEQLEDNEFKEKELGEEWRVWYVSYYKFVTNRNPRGRTGAFYLSQREAELARDSGEIFNAFGPNEFSIETYILTPRLMLQLIGTEAMRNLIHPNIWVNALFADYKEPTHMGTIDKVIHDLKGDKDHFPKWIITDVRFMNEINAIRERNGIIIKIDRQLVNSTDLHESETALDGYDGFDYKVNNYGSVANLIHSARYIITHAKLLER